MCLLIHQPKGVTFSKAELADFVDHNADGFGFMYGDGKLLHFLKMMGNAKDVTDAYYAHVAGRDAVLHFRMATHGPKTEENAHPFAIVPGIMLAHNGILSIGNPYDETKTDTEHLVEHFIRPLALQDPSRLFDAKWGEMLGKMIGTSNKLAIAHADGRVALINEDAGVRHKGAWMSNTYAWSNHYASAKKYAGSGWSGAWKGYGNNAPVASNKGTGKNISALAWEDDPYDDETGIYASDWDSLHTAYLAATDTQDVFSEMALYGWINSHPTQAMRLLVAFRSYTSEQASRVWEDSPDAVTEMLYASMQEAGYFVEDEEWDFGADEDVAESAA